MIVGVVFESQNRRKISFMPITVLPLGMATIVAAQAKDMPLDLVGWFMGIALRGITCGIVMIKWVIRYVGLLSSCRYTLSNS